MKALGFDLPKSEITSILHTHGIPANTINTSSATVSRSKNPQGAPSLAGPTKLLLPLQSFQQIMAAKMLARDPRDEINRAFDLLDVDGKGGISVEDLRRVARELNEGLQEDELNAMIDEFDLDGDGIISREEFLGICMS
jgi:centrin-3